MKPLKNSLALLNSIPLCLNRVRKLKLKIMVNFKHKEIFNINYIVEKKRKKKEKKII